MPAFPNVCQMAICILVSVVSTGLATASKVAVHVVSCPHSGNPDMFCLVSGL